MAADVFRMRPRHSRKARGPMDQAFAGPRIADPTAPVEIGHLARSVDSCLVSAVHTHGEQSGRERARFRIGEGR